MACDVRQVDTAMEQFATAESEWENVTEITAQFKEEGEGEITGLSAAPAITALVTVEEVVEYLKTHGDMEQFLSQVKSGGRRSGVRKFFSCLLGPPSLPPHLRQSVRQVQATALISFSNEEAIHLAMLRTIYRQLTCTTLDCPRYGAHWEEIGFQGSDPSTDLRGVGILGLVQALFLVVTPEILPFSQDLYKLSRKEGQEFPLLVLSLNMTRITVQAVRDGILNRQLAAEEDVWRTVNFFYCSLLHQVYTNWRQRNLTIRDCGPLIQQTEQLARTRAGNLVSQFEKFLTTQYTVGVKQAARQQIEKYSSTRVMKS